VVQQHALLYAVPAGNAATGKEAVLEPEMWTSKMAAANSDLL
jgi:hypothetical protein